jgi:hypothetical protein
VTKLRLLDHIVSAGEQRIGDGEAERLRSLEIDHQFELGRLLDGKGTWRLSERTKAALAAAKARG